ncbi:MAG: DNA polymerase II large subunit, partial [Candidatus Bathyarchaeia archaeon]
TVQEAICLSNSLKIPFHPFYTYFWSNISLQDIQKLRFWLLNSQVKFGETGIIVELRGNMEELIKNLLERICIPHRISGSEIIIEGEEAHAFAFTLGFHNPTKRIINEKSVIENLTHLSGITIKDKAPSFIGARVGRPEKAKRREMKPVVQLLFPTGLSGGPKRDLMKACGKGIIHVEVVKRVCPNCRMATFKPLCSNCGIETVLEMICPKCERSLDKEECPICKVKAKNYHSQSIPLKDMVEEACSNVKYVPDQIKGVKGLTSRTKTPEIIEKGVLRAKYDLSVYKDGTVRFDATNAPLTHFKPSEIGVSVQKLRELGYIHDYMGKPLINSDQICELKVQDIIIPWKSVDYLIRTANFVDELLQKVYGLPRYYNVGSLQDLIGLIVIGLAPHTCAGIVGRIIGFTKLNVCFAHPFWHSAKRRDCDGDEDSIILALDAFLNFSREYLPDQIGGIMDSPLFVIQSISPEEVQRQAHDFDVAFKYPLVFYESTFKNISPRDVVNLVDIVKHRFSSEAQYQGFGFTVPTFNINSGNQESVYKTLKRMIDKLNAQLKLAEKIEAVDARQVAETVLTTHFIRDISGNLRAFTTQNFRCKKCNKRFRRVPLKGRCSECNGELTLTVYRGGIEKYLEAAHQLVKRYGISEYYAQRLALVEEEISSLFESGKDTKQVNLSKFLAS